MKYPYLILSDSHLHGWSAFSRVNPDGVNSRLRIILDEHERAASTLKKLGGDTIFHAGDLFHQRGVIRPEVLNPAIDSFRKITKSGLSVIAIAGNHDLAGQKSEALGNAMQALGEIKGFDPIVSPTVLPDVVLVPWIQDLAELRATLKKLADPTKDAIIHAPVNGVIKGIPDHGLETSELAALGFRRVFAGHYHSHLTFEDDKVVSVGATTGQTWSDVGTKSGFILVYEDRIEHVPSNAPQFIDLNSEIAEAEIETLVAGNYIRLKLDDATEKDIKGWREDLIEAGALGVSIIATKKAVTGRTGASLKAASSLEASVEHFVREDLKPLLADDVSRLAQEVLVEARG